MRNTNYEELSITHYRFRQKPLGSLKILLIIADTSTIAGQCFTGRQFGNALDLYSEGTRVESRPQYRLYWMFHCFPQSCQTTAVIITSIKLRPFPSKPFPIHYSPVILPSTLTNVTQWECRWTDNYYEYSALAAVSLSEYCSFRSDEGSRFLHPHAQTAWLKTKHYNLSGSRERHVQHQKIRIFSDTAVRTSNLKQKFYSWNKIRSARWSLVRWSVTALKYQYGTCRANRLSDNLGRPWNPAVDGCKITLHHLVTAHKCRELNALPCPPLIYSCCAKQLSCFVSCCPIPSVHFIVTVGKSCLFHWSHANQIGVLFSQRRLFTSRPKYEYKEAKDIKPMYGTDDGPDDFLSADCHSYL